MADRREEIWQSLILSEKYFKEDNITEAQVYDAMDEYMRECCLELLEYMAKNSIECTIYNGIPLFNYKGEGLSKEQLFENFL